MIIDLTFSNFGCFKTEQQFSMQRLTSEAKRARAAGKWNHPNISTVTAIYGPNAAGKSTALEAFAYISKLVRTSFNSSAAADGANRKPFALDETSASKPSKFLVLFYDSHWTKHQFEFSVDNNRILYESLRTWLNSSKSSLLYEREAIYENGKWKQAVEFGRSFRGAKKLYLDALQPNTLLLSVLGATGNKQTLPAFQFLAKEVFFGKARNYKAELNHIKHDLLKDGTYKQAMLLLIDASNLGIVDAKVDTPQFSTIIDMMGGEEEGLGILKDQLRPMLASKGELSYKMSEIEQEKILNDALDELKNATIPGDILLGHTAEQGVKFFDQSLESQGTLAALAFLSLALRGLASKHVLLVDEIETSLHPAYVNALVNLFQDPDTNPNESQLIFTTHDISLVERATDSGGTIKRDQVWFVEKDATGSSELFPLSQLGVRDNENIARNYLNHVYGAMPNPHLKSAFAEALSLLKEDQADTNE